MKIYLAANIHTRSGGTTRTQFHRGGAQYVLISTVEAADSSGLPCPAMIADYTYILHR